MNHSIHPWNRFFFFVGFLLVALLSACSSGSAPSESEREAAAAATLAAAKATEVAAAQIQAELTRAAMPTDTPIPTETPAPTAAEKVTATKKILAAEGGNIELSDGTRLEIPPDALSEDGEVSITRLDALPPEAGDFDGLRYKTYEIVAPTHTLEVPATLTFSYEDLLMDDVLTPDAVFAASWDGTDWQYLGGTADPVHNTLTITTNHFSNFSLFSLPSITEIKKRIESLFATCKSLPQDERTLDTRLSEIVLQLAKANSGVRSLPVYSMSNSGTFTAGPDSISVDMEWFANQANWLPAAKRDLLLIPILGHELSHSNRKIFDWSVSFDVITRSIGEHTADEILKEVGYYLYNTILSIAQNDCKKTQTFLEALVVKMPIYAFTCRYWHKEELIADLDGVNWSKNYLKANDKRDYVAEIGLIYATFFDRSAVFSSCSHPSDRFRAEQIVTRLRLGPEGGIYGIVNPPFTAISVDGKPQDTTDENGQFLIIGLEEGEHTIQLTKADFKTQTLSINVDKQRLIDITKNSPISLQPLDLTPIPKVTRGLTSIPKATPGLTPIPKATATPTPIPKATPTPTPIRRPGLITDFETWGTWRRGDQAWGTFTQSKEQVYIGANSGKITYGFPASSDNFVVFLQTIPIPGQPASLKIMVYGDGSASFLNAWVQDANNQLWQFTFGQINHTGWQPMNAAFDLSRGWPNQPVGGAPKTSAPVYPLRLHALVLDGVREDAPTQGVVYVDELFAGPAELMTPIPVVTRTLTSTPIANTGIAFSADRTNLNAGECANLRWDVDNVTAIFLDGQGVTGHESRQVCPAATQTYTLMVARQDGSQQQAAVTILVTGGVAAPTSTPSAITAGPCEAIPGESYGALSIQGSPSDRPAESHADLNLAMRGYQGVGAALQFSDYGPADDPNGPQLPGLFGDGRVPAFTSSYQVFDWDWNCNCRSNLLTQWETTLLGMGVSPGEPIRVPDSGYSIGNGYEVLVLYASPDRITLKYTPNDNVVSGYTLHVEGVCVDPYLLGLYQSQNASGRRQLPALRSGQAFGRAKGGEILVGIRDAGTFLDPRSRQDWWRGR